MTHILIWGKLVRVPTIKSKKEETGIIYTIYKNLKKNLVLVNNHYSFMI